MTLKDIANETGFSIITVSRVVRNPDLVKKETREIIEQAIKKYNYTPNSLAQALVYKRTNIIYLYMPPDLESTHPFVMQLIAGIGSYAGEQGYSVLLKREWYDEQPCDGLILVGLTLEDEASLVSLNQKKPLVLFGHHDLVDWIDVDNAYGSQMITEYVLNRGYRNLVYLGINQRKKFTKDRLNGFTKAVSTFNQPVNSQVLLCDNKENEGYEAAMQLLTQPEKPEVIVCASDYLAIGVMRAANKLNIQIPEQLGVTGFDGLGFENLVSPYLTTVRQPIYEIGYDLAKKLLYKINQPKNKQSGTYYKPELIVKDTLK